MNAADRLNPVRQGLLENDHSDQQMGDVSAGAARAGASPYSRPCVYRHALHRAPLHRQPLTVVLDPRRMERAVAERVLDEVLLVVVLGVVVLLERLDARRDLSIAGGGHLLLVVLA